MSDTHKEPMDASEYLVIGATESPDDEPLRLRPIVRSRTPPHRYGLLYENDAGDEALVEEDEPFILEEMRAGRFFQLPCPIPMKPRHWLLQLEAGRPPEYLDASEAPARLAEVARIALRKCAQAVAAGDKESAREHVGYASVAEPEDPFPVIARIALWREDLSASQLRWELEALEDFTNEQVEARFRAVRNQPDLKPLLHRILGDPLSERYALAPDWLPRRPKHAPRKPSGFFGRHLSLAPAAA